MIYDPRILNLSLCFMKGRVIRYSSTTLLISVLHSKIVRGGRAYSCYTYFLEEGGHLII